MVLGVVAGLCSKAVNVVRGRPSNSVLSAFALFFANLAILASTPPALMSNPHFPKEASCGE